MSNVYWVVAYGSVVSDKQSMPVLQDAINAQILAPLQSIVTVGVPPHD